MLWLFKHVNRTRPSIKGIDVFNWNAFLTQFIYLIWIRWPPSRNRARKVRKNISIPERAASISYSNKFTFADDENVAWTFFFPGSCKLPQSFIDDGVKNLHWWIKRLLLSMRRRRRTVGGMLLSSSLQPRRRVFSLYMCSLSADVNHCFTVNT